MEWECNIDVQIVMLAKATSIVCANSPSHSPFLSLSLSLSLSLAFQLLQIWQFLFHIVVLLTLNNSCIV